MNKPLLCLAALSALTLAPLQHAQAGFLGPSSNADPTTSLAECSRADEMTTCILTGRLTRQEYRNRYLFEAEGGRMIVDIPPHVFGKLDVSPEQTVRLTGEVGGKRHPDRQDPHLRVRYIEVLP